MTIRGFFNNPVDIKILNVKPVYQIRYKHRKRGHFGNIVVDESDPNFGYNYTGTRSKPFDLNKDVLDKNFQKKKVKK